MEKNGDFCERISEQVQQIQIGVANIILATEYSSEARSTSERAGVVRVVGTNNLKCGMYIWIRDYLKIYATYPDRLFRRRFWVIYF